MNRILSVEIVDRYGRTADCAQNSPVSEYGTGDFCSGRRGRSGSSGRVRVTPEVGEPFTISARRAACLGIAEGAELSNECHAEILQMLRASCMQRCGTLLGSRDYPVQRLREKLADAGYPSSIIEECIGKLAGAHYLDDRRYAQT